MASEIYGRIEDRKKLGTAQEKSQLEKPGYRQLKSLVTYLYRKF
jgi:hypothetical protein